MESIELLILVILVLVVSLPLMLGIVASIGGYRLGERLILGHIKFVQVAPCTFPKRLGITMDDGTYIILDRPDLKIDTSHTYRIIVREKKYWWGVESDIVTATPALGAK